MYLESLFVTWFSGELCLVRAVSGYSSLPRLITINKSADFLIVTPQKSCFPRILQKIGFTIKKMTVFLIVISSLIPPAVTRMKLPPGAFMGGVESSHLSLPTRYSGGIVS